MHPSLYTKARTCNQQPIDMDQDRPVTNNWLLTGVIACLLFPSLSHAMTADDIVAIPPVSEHYVQRILDRTNAGIARASTMTTAGGPLFTILKPWWIFYATSAMLSTVETRMQLTSTQRDLLESTPCLHLDVIILQSKIEKVRQEMHIALDAGQPWRVMLLQQLIRFLNLRVEHLLRGGRDPLYEDPNWARRQWFDPVNPVWCCPHGTPANTCTYMDDAVCIAEGGISFETPRGCQEYGCFLPESQNPLEGKLCPFHSDYLPPSIAGYGCDEEALPPEASGHPSTAAEMEALATLILERDAFVTQAQTFAALVADIDAMTGGSSNENAAGLGLSRRHYEVSGCLESMPLAREIGAVSLLQRMQTGAAETRGPFSIPKNEPWIMVRFVDLLKQWGERRPNERPLRYPSEFPPGDEREAAKEREQNKPSLIRAGEWFLRTFFFSWNRFHAQREAVAIPKAQDNILQIRESSPGMGAVSARLGGLVGSHSSGVRRFGKSFAYYLRRSCIYRPCNAKLDQILRIMFKDSCFPYMSGAYFGNPLAHEQCKTDAEIDFSR